MVSMKTIEGGKMKIDDYDRMIEMANKDLEDAKYRRDYWYMKSLEIAAKLQESEDFVMAIESTIAYYKGLRDNALMVKR